VNAAAHTSVNVTQPTVFHWDTVHVQKDISEPLLILMPAAQLNDASHVNTPHHPHQPPHQSLMSTQQLLTISLLAHHITTHVMIAKETNEFTETAGHQRPAHTVNVTVMEKFDVPRLNVPSWLHARRDKNELSNQPPMDVVT